MPTPKTRRRPPRAQNLLLKAGMLAAGLGLAGLFGPAIVGGSPLLKPMADALRGPGALALGLAVVLLIVHFSLAFKNSAALQVADADDNRQEPEFANNQPGVAPQPPHPAPESAWSPAVFAAIEWRRFEAVCEALFAQAGFETRSQPHGADGGVDIWLHSAHAKGPAAVVQCKHWQGKPLGVKEVREFFGVMASHRLQRGTYATSSSYTADAQKFAKANGINAMDGNALLALIARRTPQQQQALLAIAYEGDYWRPTCASCGVKMVARTPAKGGAGFWGCANFPRCRRTLPMAA